MKGMFNYISFFVYVKFYIIYCLTTSYKSKKTFIVTTTSDDNVIESIEYVDDNHFVIGVQFHPEDLKNTENLYNYFIKEVLKRKK